MAKVFGKVVCVHVTLSRAHMKLSCDHVTVITCARDSYYVPTKS